MQATLTTNSQSFDSFLSDAIMKAHQAADATVALHKVVAAKTPPAAFDSNEDWHSFDAMVAIWLQQNEQRPNDSVGRCCKRRKRKKPANHFKVAA